jgi:hypothetical protein
MALHRYWRIRAVTVAASFLEISELQLFDGATRVDGPATKSSSIAPDSGGGLGNMSDGNLATRLYWTQAHAQDSSFWIAWDFGSATEVNAIKQGGYDTSGRHISAFTVQASDDASIWFDVASFSALSYPGNNTLSSAYAWVSYEISGTVFDASGSPAARNVYAYLRSTGALIGATSSAGDGSYTISVGSNAEAFVVALPGSGETTVNAQVLDRVVPL